MKTVSSLTETELVEALHVASATDPSAVAELLDERARRIASAAAANAAEAEAYWTLPEPLSAPLAPSSASLKPTETTSAWALRTVRCPHCRRGPGSPCVTRDGHTVAGGRRVHPERVTAASRAARTK